MKRIISALALCCTALQAADLEKYTLTRQLGGNTEYGGQVNAYSFNNHLLQVDNSRLLIHDLRNTSNSASEVQQFHGLLSFKAFQDIFVLKEGYQLHAYKITEQGPKKIGSYTNDKVIDFSIYKNTLAVRLNTFDEISIELIDITENNLTNGKKFDFAKSTNKTNTHLDQNYLYFISTAGTGNQAMHTYRIIDIATGQLKEITTNVLYGNVGSGYFVKRLPSPAGDAVYRFNGENFEAIYQLPTFTVSKTSMMSSEGTLFTIDKTSGNPWGLCRYNLSPASYTEKCIQYEVLTLSDPGFSYILSNTGFAYTSEGIIYFANDIGKLSDKKVELPPYYTDMGILQNHFIALFGSENMNRAKGLSRVNTQTGESIVSLIYNNKQTVGAGLPVRWNENGISFLTLEQGLPGSPALFRNYYTYLPSSSDSHLEYNTQTNTGIKPANLNLNFRNVFSTEEYTGNIQSWQDQSTTLQIARSESPSPYYEFSNLRTANNETLPASQSPQNVGNIGETLLLNFIDSGIFYLNIDQNNQQRMDKIAGIEAFTIHDGIVYAAQKNVIQRYQFTNGVPTLLGSATNTDCRQDTVAQQLSVADNKLFVSSTLTDAQTGTVQNFICVYSLSQAQPSHLSQVEVPSAGNAAKVISYQGALMIRLENDGRLFQFAPDLGPVIADSVVLAEDQSTDTLLQIHAPNAALKELIILQAPQHGTASVKNLNISYQPAPNYHGTDSVKVQATDLAGHSTEQLVNITITSVNDAPVAEPLQFSVTVNQSHNGQLKASDVDGDALTFSLVSAAKLGTATVNADGSFTYQANSSGDDSFSYKVSDGQGGEHQAQVNITVTPPANKAPLAEPLQFSVTVNQSYTGQLKASDADGDALTFSLVSAAKLGTVTLSANGSFSYQASSSGADSFSYKVSDGRGGEHQAQVDITVTPPANKAPVAEPLQFSVTVNQNHNGQLKASDADGDTLTFSLVSAAKLGTVTVNANGSFSYQASSSGDDSFSYKVSDGRGGEQQALVSIKVNPVSSGGGTNPTNPTNPGTTPAADSSGGGSMGVSGLAFLGLLALRRRSRQLH